MKKFVPALFIVEIANVLRIFLYLIGLFSYCQKHFGLHMKYSIPQFLERSSYL